MAMINLLPNEVKTEIRAAKLNTVLVSYIVVILLGSITLGGLTAGAYYILNDTKVTADKAVAANNERASVYEDTRSQAIELQSNLNNAREALDANIDYSTLLTSFAALMPEGVVIDEIELNASALSNDITVSVLARDTESILAFRDALSSSVVVTNVKLGNVSNSGSDEIYKAEGELSFTFNRGAAQ